LDVVTVDDTSQPSVPEEPERRFISLELEFEEAENVLKDLEDRWNHPTVDRMIRLLRQQLEFKE
jgi:predicted metal-dependent hydrolase